LIEIHFLEALGIAFICLSGLGYTSYKNGIRDGASKTFKMLETHAHRGRVTIDFDGENVYFNKDVR
jgi:hypothetical protein